MSAALRDLLDAAAILTGDRDAALHIERAKRTREQILSGQNREAGLQPVLQQRLAHFMQTRWHAQLSTVLFDASVQEHSNLLTKSQHTTAWFSLACLIQVHATVAQTMSKDQGEHESALLGARDLAMIKKLLVAAFSWLVVPSVEVYDGTYRTLFPSDACAMSNDTRIREANIDEAAWKRASKDLAHISLALNGFFHGSENVSRTALPVSDVARTDVAVLVLRIYFVDVLRVLIRIAYGNLPEELASAAQNAQSGLHTLLESLPTSIGLAALRGVPAVSALSSNTQGKRPRIPPFVREHAARLLSAQLLRPEGVRSLLIGMLGANEADMLSGDIGDESADGDSMCLSHAATFKRLEGATRLLTTPPKGISRNSYYKTILPHVLTVLDPVPPPNTTPVHGLHRRAAAFTVMRMFERSPDVVHATMGPCVFHVLLGTRACAHDIDRAVRLLGSLVLLAPPSPDFVQSMIAPLATRLLQLDTFLEQTALAKIQWNDQKPTRDTLKNEVHELLHTWLRLGAYKEINTVLLRAMHAGCAQGNCAWHETKQGIELIPVNPYTTEEMNLESFFQNKTLSFDQLKQRLSLDESNDVRLPPELLQPLNFSILPARIAVLCKHAQRPDLAKEMLLTALEEYSRAQVQKESQVSVSETSATELERRSVYYLQLLGQLLETFGSDILDGDLNRIFHFIDYACSQPSEVPAAESKEGAMESLLDIQSSELGCIPQHDWELVCTALNLLLSLLEKHTNIQPQTSPMLNALRLKVEHLRDAPNLEVRSLSQEVVLVLDARTQQVTPRPTVEQPKYLDIYREALQHLQDPIIPVRAHGLHLLAQLVSKSPQGVHYGNELDPALLPAIFDIFVDAIQDEESFLYLNAVKGLAQMTAHWRESTLRPLVALYVGGGKTQTSLTQALAYGQNLSQRETDKRLRIGEAMLQVVQYCGEAIIPSIHLIVQPVLTAVRNPVFSATLRSSFISILGTIVEIAPAALAANGASNEMVQLCHELIKLESVRRPMMKAAAVQAHVMGYDSRGNLQKTKLDDADEEREARDTREARAGVDVDPKLPQLRRSALLLIAVLLRGTRHQLEDYIDQRQKDNDSLVPNTLSALRLPGGGMLPDTGTKQREAAAPVPLVRCKAVRELIPTASFVANEDIDALAQQQARDCVQEAQLLESAFVAAHAAGFQ